MYSIFCGCGSLKNNNMCTNKNCSQYLVGRDQPCSFAQMEYIKSLCKLNEVEEPSFINMSKDDASALINRLLMLNK